MLPTQIKNASIKMQNITKELLKSINSHEVITKNKKEDNNFSPDKILGEKKNVNNVK